MRVFVLTGAGISAESGLGTFRDTAGEGIWSRFDPLKLATPEAFAADPDAVHAFCNARRQNLLGATRTPPTRRWHDWRQVWSSGAANSPSSLRISMICTSEPTTSGSLMSGSMGRRPRFCRRGRSTAHWKWGQLRITEEFRK